MTGNETVNLFIFKGLNEEIRNMTKNSKIAGIVLGSIFAATALTAANDAMALDVGQCLPMAQMNQALIADGQRTLIIGDRVAINNSTASNTGLVVNRWVNTVTSNVDGSLGYQLEGDKPRAETSNQVCVAAKLTNIQLLDARANEVPKEAYLGGRFEQTINNAASAGFRPMLISDTVFNNGTINRNGLPIIVMGKLSERFGSISAYKPSGNLEMLVQYQNLDYTPVALQRLASNPQNITLTGLNK